MNSTSETGVVNSDYDLSHDQGETEIFSLVSTQCANISENFHEDMTKIEFPNADYYHRDIPSSLRNPAWLLQ